MHEGHTRERVNGQMNILTCSAGLSAAHEGTLIVECIHDCLCDAACICKLLSIRPKTPPHASVAGAGTHWRRLAPINILALVSEHREFDDQQASAAGQ